MSVPDSNQYRNNFLPITCPFLYTEKDKLSYGKGGISMIRYFIKQKVFSWRDRFTVKDETGRDVYYVEGSVFSWGKKLTVFDMNGNDVLYIEQKLWNWLPTFSLYVQGQEVAEVKKELTFLKPRYAIFGP